MLWYKTFIDWMDRWVKAPAAGSAQSGASSRLPAPNGIKP